MRTWKVTVTLIDHAKDDETGETFRHLTKKQIQNLVVDKLDLPAAVRYIRAYTEESGHDER